jgi:hypothetical protein
MEKLRLIREAVGRNQRFELRGLRMKSETIERASLGARARLIQFALFALLVALVPSLAHAGTWVAFGPKIYTRGTGAPVTVTYTFTLLNPATQYTLKAFNGGMQNDTTDLVSNSVVLLNGVQVIGPANFNQGVLEVDIPITPQASNTISVQVRGKPGGVLAIEIIGVDNDPPTITASLSPAPNAAGWNNSPVTVSFTCSDRTSGVASCPSPFNVSTEGASQVVSGTATDLAGNTATTSMTVNLDMTPPTITGSINPPPDVSGYNSSAARATFTCADALSGVASCSPPVTVTTEGSFPETGTAVDVAGNTASVTITVNISFNYFKIRSWQTNPGGDPLQTGKCLDYGVSPSGNGASVFLNDCGSAHPIRVAEIAPRDQKDAQGTTIPLCSSQDNPAPSPPTPHTFCHEVMLFAGKQVIGIHNPPMNIFNGGTPPPPSLQSEYALELQDPGNGVHINPLTSPGNQIFALDGDSIILEISRPCVNTDTTTSSNICPAPPSQMVIQIQNARGANGSPLVAGVRNLADNEFWDFVAQPSSRPYPTSGFQSVSSPDGLWNAICLNPAAPPPPIPPTSTCAPNSFKAGWGSVILISSPVDCSNVPGPYPNQVQDIGGCVNLTNYPPIFLPAGVTIRGGRRGTSFGPQLYDYNSIGALIFDVWGDYVRVTGLRLRGQSRSRDDKQPGGTAIQVESLEPLTVPLLATTTQFIATVDHNDVSDWTSTAIAAHGPYTNDSHGNCIYTYQGGNTYTQIPCSDTINIADAPIKVGDDASTLANTHVARNFIHYNQENNLGYGVGIEGGGRAFVEANTFNWNRHAIASDAEPHDEYRAANNLVLSGSPSGDQDFDMHGSGCPLSHCGYGGTGGFYVDIVGNTFLATDRANYWLRGQPVFDTDFHHNVSLQNSGSALAFHTCFPIFCMEGSYPINPFDNQFANSSPPYSDPTTRLGPASFGVGDFDGDGDDDLFLATGVAWYYSPAGARDWRFLNSAPDTIDQLLFGDFDGDGRTDVVGLRNGQLVVSWGGISAFEVLNANPPPCTSISDMAVGDFDGDGHPDIFCADGATWWISYGGNTPFVQVIVASPLHVNQLRFGDFNGDGTTDVFGVVNGNWMVRYGPKSYQGLLGAWQPLPFSLTSTIDGLYAADFLGIGRAVVAKACDSPQGSWCIAEGYPNWTPYNLQSSALYVGGVGHFGGRPNTNGNLADLLLWNGNEFFISEGGIFPAGSWSSQDMR